MNEAEELKKLLSNDLAFLLSGFLILQRLVWVNFFESAESETIPRKVLAGAMLLVSMGIAYANFTIHPGAATAVAELWWVQGLIFWGGLLLADFLLAKAYRTPRPEGSVESSSVGGRMGAIVAALALSAVAGSAAAATPPLAIERLSGGLAAQAAIYTGSAAGADPGPVATFAPKAWLSYSILEEVSGHVSGQWGLAPRIDEYHVGVSVRLLREDPVRVAAAVDAIWYDGVDPGGTTIEKAVEYSLRFSKVLRRSAGAPRIGLQLQAGWIPARADDHEFTYRAGLNWHAFGGRVVP